MHFATKTIALTLVVALLGQTSLYAQIQGPVVSLEALQEQAAKSSLSLREKGLIIGGVATSVALLVSVQRIARYKIILKNQNAIINAFQTVMAQEGNAASAEVRIAQAEAKAAQAQVAAEQAQKSLTSAEKTIKSFKSQREYYEYIIQLREKDLKEANTLLAKRNTAAQQYLAGSVSLSERESKFIEKCADLLLETSPKEQAIYKDAIFSDRVFTRMSPAEQARFRANLDEILRAVRAHQPLGAETYKTLGRMILLDHNIPTTQRFLRGIGEAMVQKSSKAALPIALLVFIMIPTQNARAQQHDAEQANRILNDVNFLINATPEQLQQMQENPKALQAAIVAASALQTLDDASEETLPLLQEELARQRIHASLQVQQKLAR